MRKFVDFVNNNKFFCCFILAVLTLLCLFRINMYDRHLKGDYLYVINKITNSCYSKDCKLSIQEILDRGIPCNGAK